MVHKTAAQKLAALLETEVLARWVTHSEEEFLKTLKDRHARLFTPAERKRLNESYHAVFG